jgi:hypothetical protein
LDKNSTKTMAKAEQEDKKKGASWVEIFRSKE